MHKDNAVYCKRTSENIVLSFYVAILNILDINFDSLSS